MTRGHHAATTPARLSSERGWEFDDPRAMLHQQSAADPERKLRVAVLESAFADAKALEHGFTSRPNSMHRVAELLALDHLERWLHGALARITFADCCASLDLHPEYVRRGIEHYLTTVHRLRHGH